MRKVKPIIRPLESKDIPEIAAAFQQLGWNKPASQYEHYLAEQERKVRDIYVPLWKESLQVMSLSLGHPGAKGNDVVDFRESNNRRRQKRPIKNNRLAL